MYYVTVRDVHRTLKTFWGMHSRCNDPSDPAYKYYGGRGIAICPRWYKFACFAADMGLRPENRTLDRIDNDGNYRPDNCRWATAQEQLDNRRMQWHTPSVEDAHPGHNVPVSVEHLGKLLRQSVALIEEEKRKELC